MSSASAVRWGDRKTSSSGNSQTAVSDQEALDALVVSASSKHQDGRRRHNDRNHNHSNVTDGNNRGKRPRGMQERENGGGKDYSSYGRNQEEKGDGTNSQNKEGGEIVVDKERPNFGLSGALAQEQVGELKISGTTRSTSSQYSMASLRLQGRPSSGDTAYFQTKRIPIG